MKKYFFLLSLFSTLFFSINLRAITRQMEFLNRGLVAVKTSGGVYLSWRLLGTENRSTTFNIYRNNVKITSVPFAASTNYTDASGTITSIYKVLPVVDGVEIQEDAKNVTPWAAQYKSIQLKRPVGGITEPNQIGSVGKATTDTFPSGQEYTYAPNDFSVGDLDGDGEYELVVKWNPTNAQDNSYYGITGKVYLDAYNLDGTFLWRIDLGKNIRAGAHYTQFMVYDLNGDGRAEVVCKTAPGTIDGKGNYVLLNSDDPNADYRNLTYAAISGPTMLGAIVNGPEYLTLFDGLTGEALHTISYKPERGSISSWGDSYGNRVDRHLACVAYLDGVKPSVVMCRGYYTRSTLVAYDVIDKKLVERWYHNSTVSGQGAYGEGFHNLSVADVDQDGRDEIIYGSCAIDDNGLLLYRSGTGHGDAMHVSDMDPDRPGLEIWTIHEDTKSPYGYQLRDAKTGQNLWGVFTGTDVGRGMAGDVDARYRGFEMWSYALDSTFDCKGNKISKSKPASNFRIYWDGDVQDELLDGVKITKWNGSGNTTLLTASSYLNSASTNTTKSNPCISADILGDWREEVIYYNSADPSRINLFTTVTSTTNKLYTLMHDPVYRLGIAWQNVAYNQPPHLGFYLGDGVANAPVPDIYLAKYDGGTGLEIEKSGLKVFLKQDILNVTGINSESKIYIYDIMGKLITVKQLLEAGTAEISVPSDEHLLIVKICQNNSVKSYKIVR